MVDYDAWDEKPLPRIDAESEEFWARAADGELVIQRCADCGERQFYPRWLCRHCWSEAVEFESHEGTGSIYSYTINHLPGQSGYGDETPYPVVLVELDLPEENPSGRPVRMTSHVIDCDAEELEIDMPVEVAFRRVSDDPEVALPVFELRSR